MKTLPLVLTFAVLSSALAAQTPAAAPARSAAPAVATAPAARMVSDVYIWDQIPVTPNAKGVRRAVFDGPTTTLGRLHCHITTLNPGEKSGEPSKHVQEEVIIVKEGSVEANWDGQSKIGGPGSVIFFAAGATTFLRNAGPTPCTYTVINYYVPAAPKG